MIEPAAANRLQERGSTLRLKRDTGIILAILGFVFVGFVMKNDRSLLSPCTTEIVKYVKVNDSRNRSEVAESIESTAFGRQPKAPMRDLEQEEKLKCSPWDADTDTWWQQHPDWEPHLGNATHTCFRPIPNQERAAFYRDIYESQYHNKDCSQIRTRSITGVGYAAAVGYMTSGFWSAYRQGYPFQTTLPFDRNPAFRWMYVPPFNTTDGQNRSWATCPSQDHECYFLPISNCERQAGRPQDYAHPLYCKKEIRENPMRREQHMWLKTYLTRPRKEVRRRLLQLLEKEAPVVDTPCTWIHVRRADAMSETKNLRNFYPLSEYLERGNVKPGDNILLLTDDETTLEEAHLLHPEYQWRYWNRTRHRGAMERNSHNPSNDEAREMLIILAELQLAGKCIKGVHGTSNMVDMFTVSMVQEHGLDNIQLIQIDEELKKERKDPHEFLVELEAKLQAARNATRAS